MNRTTCPNHVRSCPVDTDGLNRTDKPSLLEGCPVSGIRSGRKERAVSVLGDSQTVALPADLLEALSDLLADVLVADYRADLVRDGQVPEGNQP
jgi:hypothetical protein